MSNDNIINVVRSVMLGNTQTTLCVMCRNGPHLCTAYGQCDNADHYFASAAVDVHSSPMTASSSTLWSRFSPPSNDVNWHGSTMWFMVCRWPQSQAGDWARPHLCKLARHGPWPVRKRFIRDHVWQGRWKPGCRIVGSVTIVWLSTEADDQSSLHCVIVSTDVMSAAYWASRCKPWSAYTGNLDGLRSSSSFYLPNNTTVYTFARIRFRRAGRQGPIRTLTPALKRLMMKMMMKNGNCQNYVNATNGRSSVKYKTIDAANKTAEYIASHR